MIGIFAGKTVKASTIASRTKGVSFNQAMDDYRKTVGYGRAHTIAYKYCNDGLEELIKEHFNVFFIKGAIGDMTIINHNGFEYIIIIKGELVGKTLFTITKNY